MSKKLNGGGWERAPQVEHLSFKICQKGPKNALFLVVLVSGMSMHGGHLH